MEIYKLINVLTNYPLDIECVYGYDNFLLVGTKQGNLLHYKTVLLNETKFEVRLLRSNKDFAKKAINQIAAIPEFNIAIVLSDGLIKVFNLDNIQDPCRSTIDKARYCTMFIVDLQKLKTITDEYQYALRICVVLKKKLMFFYWKKGEFYHIENSDLFLNDTVKSVAWCKETIYLGFKNDYFRVKIGEKMKELFPVGTKCPEPFVECLSSNKFVLGKDENTYFFNEEGDPILKYPLTWSSNLLKIVDDLIYIIGLLPNNQIEIKTIEPKMQIQTIIINKLSKLKQLTKCANKNGLLYLCSTSEVYAMVIVDYNQQLTQLIEAENFEIAHNLAIVYNTENENKPQLEYIKYLQAFDYFCKMQFSDAFKIYSDLKIDPSIVIGLYPDLLPDEFRSKLEYPAKIPELRGANLDNAIAELSHYLIEIRRILQKPDCQFSVIKSFLATSKKSDLALTNNNIEKLKQIVDTTLLKCYLKTNDALVASLLRLPTNYCHLEEAEKVLKYYNKYNDLIILYRCRNLHRKALQLLQKVNQTSSSSVKIQDAHLRTKEYLQHLGKDHLDLIFEYAEWVLKEYPEDGIKIFIEDMSEIESLPRKEVLEYLKTVNRDFVIPYLEHVIYTWKEIDHNLHDALANEYREKIRLLLEEYKSGLKENEKPAKAGHEPGLLGSLRKKLMKFLYFSDYYTAEKLAFFFLNDFLWEERAIVLSKIGNHQEALTIYVYILNDLEKAEDYCETIYNKGNLQSSCDVFFLLLRLNLQRPIDKDNENYEYSKFVDEKKEIFYNPNEAIKPNLDTALKLLRNYATKIDPISVLNELPDTLPLSLLSVFLTSVVKNLIHKKHQVQIHRNLLLSQHLAVQKHKITLHKNNKVIIDEYSLCNCCNKRIGKSAFLKYPNQDLIHYSCKDAYEEGIILDKAM